MASSLRFASPLVAAVVAAGLAGCGAAPTNQPPHGESADLSVAAGDLALGCRPACAAPTPYCTANRQCVACVEDVHCPPGQLCKIFGGGGSCVLGCADDARCRAGGNMAMACCGGRCVDTGADPQNCGKCGAGCSGGPLHAKGSCAAGKCQIGQCEAGWGDCNKDGGDGCEANLHVDAKNCTACGMACDFKNAISACANGCYMSACQFGFDDCNNDPVDGCETSVRSDPKNCGKCGRACPVLPNSQLACMNGDCTILACNAGFADCDANSQNGCEVNLGNNLQHCGKCGNVCGLGLSCVNQACTCQQCNIPNAKTKCVNNQCVFDGCVPGFGNCDNNVGNGCEADLNNDPKSCGGCGMQCAMNLPACLAGQCTNAFCRAIGYLMCPSGKNMFCDGMMISPVNAAQAKKACEECAGGACTLEMGDCAGPGYCLKTNNQQPCWGYAMGCSGAAGRVWQYGSSFTTYGMWAM